MSLSTEIQAQERSGSGHAIRWWEIVLVPVLGMVVWFGLLVMLGAIGGIIGVKLGYSLDDIRAILQNLKTTPLMLWAVMALLYFAFLIVLGFALRGRTTLVATYGHNFSVRQVEAAVIVGIIFALGVVFGINYLGSHNIVTFHPLPSEEQLVPRSFDDLLLAFAVLALLAPYVEELLFRGLILSWLQQSLPPFVAALVSAVLFSLCHGHLILRPGAEGWVLSGVIALIGLVNAIWAQASRSLWPPLALHAAYNGTYVLLAYWSAANAGHF